MATHVQVVLKQDVDALGKVGDLVRVKPGYARNYLLPRGLAVVATRDNIQRIEHEKKAAIAQVGKEKQQSEGIAAALAEVQLRFEKKAGEEGKLFGSVTAAEVAEALKSKGYDLDRRKIEMPAGPIKTVGTHELVARLPGGVHAKLQVEVVAKGEG